MWQSFVLLFAEMTPIVLILFVLGILLCVIETFVPGFGFFGITGSILLAVGIVVRMLSGGDIFMLLYMVLIAGLIIGGMFLLVATMAKKGKLSKSKIFDVGTSVPTGLTEGTKDFSYLLGKEGIATTLLRPIGVADFDGNPVDVIAKTGSIDSGAKLKVVQVEGQRVVVEQIK